MSSMWIPQTYQYIKSACRDRPQSRDSHTQEKKSKCQSRRKHQAGGKVRQQTRPGNRGRRKKLKHTLALGTQGGRTCQEVLSLVLQAVPQVVLQVFQAVLQADLLAVLLAPGTNPAPHLLGSPNLPPHPPTGRAMETTPTPPCPTSSLAWV